MKITDVRIRKIAKDGKMKAIVSITLDDEFVVHDIKVIEGEKGLFIAMPSRKTSNGEYRDIAHPINSQTREQIQDIILKEYLRALTEEDQTFLEAADFYEDASLSGSILFNIQFLHPDNQSWFLSDPLPSMPVDILSG
jgi:stage V sporulation protein G